MSGDLIAIVLLAASAAVLIASDIYTRKIREDGRNELLGSSSERGGGELLGNSSEGDGLSGKGRKGGSRDDN